MNAALLLALLLVLPTAPAAPAAPKRPARVQPAAPAAPSEPAVRYEPLADSLFTQADAVAWLGGPLEDTFRQEEEPSSENGRDHVTVRGWYPKGWNPQTAEAPPERAIQVVVHAFADTAGAERFYEFVHDRDEGSVKHTDGPFAGFAFTSLDGLGDVAHVKHGSLPGAGGAKISLGTLSFRSGRAFVQMQVWMADGTALDRAQQAARVMAAKLR